MQRFITVLLLGFSFQLQFSVSAGKEAPKAVAFYCGRPALYLTVSGWQPDFSTDCLNEVKDIVEFCRKHYPSSNISDASFSPVIEIHLSGWCHRKSSNCSLQDASTYRIQPWICSVKEPPLLVPPGCQLREFGGPRYSVCQKPYYWTQLASSNCPRLKQMKYVKPCIKPDSYLHTHYLGAVAVCCLPSHSKAFQNPKHDTSKPMYNPTIHPPSLSTSSNGTKFETDESIIIDRNAAIYQDYLGKPIVTSKLTSNEVDKLSEHQRFSSAKKAANEAYRGRKHILERELAEAESQLSNQDWINYPEQIQEAENQLHKEFRRKYVLLDQEARTALHELLLTHQQRVFQSMERRFEAAASAWDFAINHKPSNLTQLFAAIERLHHVFERNRHHLIRQWERLQSSQPVEASSALSHLRERLDDMDLQFNRSLEKVNQVPLLKDAILDHIAQLSSKTYPQIDAMVKSLRHMEIPEDDGVQLPLPDQEAALEAEGLIAKYRHHLPKMELDKRESKTERPKESLHTTARFQKIEEANKITANATVSIPLKASKWKVEAKAVDETSAAIVDRIEDEVKTSTPVHITVTSKQEPAVQNLITTAAPRPEQLGTVAKWFVSLTTVAALVIVTLFALRYRIRRARLRRAGYTCTVAEVDEINTANISNLDAARDLREEESERLTNWRLNGYENPAYKYPENVVRFPRA